MGVEIMIWIGVYLVAGFVFGILMDEWSFTNMFMAILAGVPFVIYALVHLLTQYMYGCFKAWKER